MSVKSMTYDPATLRDADRAASAVAEILNVMARLREPGRGCAWDLEQTFATIAPYTIEEAYEVADAIQRGSMPALKEELGDLLFQVVFHARMAEEDGAFDFTDVVEALSAKMIERHPHVFGDGEGARTAESQKVAWEAQKAEKRARGGARLLDDVPQALPALMRAEKLTKRAARIGFDWPDAGEVLRKLDEERAELEEARASGDQAAIADELGDMFFVMANLARKLGVDAEECLRQANAKFERRFAFVEDRINDNGGRPHTLDEMDAFWRDAKKAERK
jgi:MazG family protein